MTSEARQSIHEKLDSIEARLIGLENASGESMDLHVAIHLLFRDFHNLKSALSMEGADLDAKLVHQAESCLDALRSGKGDSGSDWVDLLLALVDHVRTSVDTDEERDEPVLSRRLEGFLHEWLDGGQTPAREIGFPLEAAEAQALRKAVAAGLFPYILEKLVGEGLDLTDAGQLPVFEAIAEAGPLIARRLVNVPGSGSVLTVVFATDKTAEDLSVIVFDPFHPVSGSPGIGTPEPRPPDGGALKRILIVEDEAIALMLLQHFLSPYGRIDTARDGTEALDKFSAAFNGGDPYHVIFLDIMIPGIPGNRVLEEIRKREQEAGTVTGDGARIVMASSLGDYSSISASFKNQGDAYLVKPIDALTIDRTMKKLGLTKMDFTSISVPKTRKRE